MHRTAFGSLAVALLVVLVLAGGSHAPAGAGQSTEIPPGFLPFLGGGQGDPDALTPAAPLGTPCGHPLPPGYLAFFGGGASDPAALTAEGPGTEGCCGVMLSESVYSGRDSGDPYETFAPTAVPCAMP